VRLFPGTIRQPDLLFVTNEHREWLDDQFATGRPDWVAEIISPGDREIDEVTKVVEYARAGIPEYWLLDPENSTIRIHTLDGGAYALSVTASAGQGARATTITGFEVAVDDVFSES
jgi:Uma2 family endonuclease